MVRIASVLIVAFLHTATLFGAACAQSEDLVYVDDSPTAEEVLGQLPRLLAQENLSEAVTILQRLLDEEPARLVESSSDPALYHAVRARVNEAILSSDTLLERYRFVQEPLAKRLLEDGDALRAHTSLFVTPSGGRAALVLAQDAFEAGSFASAARLIIELEAHPDFGVDAAFTSDAAALLARVAPFAHDERVRQIALEFARAANMEDEISRESLAFVTPPRSALIESVGLEQPGPAFTPKEILPRPLRSSGLGPAESAAESGASLLRGQRLAAGRPEPWVMPVLAGDLVLVGDLQSLSAWDRLTLERRWRFVPPKESDTSAFDFAMQNARRGVDTGAQDSATPVVGGGIVLALTHDTSTNRPSTPMLNAISAETGDLVWSRLPAELQSEWREAQFSGTPVIAGDLAIVSLFQFSPLRRVMSAHLAALDLYTGEMRWSRLLGTAGISPSQRVARAVHLGITDAGVVYKVDPIGIASAIDARSGEPLWVRKLAPEEPYAGDPNQPWHQTAPILLEDRIILLAPDRMTIEALSRKTGEKLAEREASAFGWPDYLLHVGESLVAVGSQFAVLPLTEFTSGTPQSIEFDEEGNLNSGRMRVAGDRLLIPAAGGIRVIDPADASGNETVTPLDYPGAPVAVGDQLIVTDGAYIHAYLPWETADRALRARMEAQRDDPDLALTYAELAYRAGVIERIPMAADRALSAIEQIAGSQRAETARDRLYEALSAMLSADLARGNSLVNAKAISNRQRGELVERLGRAASTPDQRVGYHMERGRHARLERKWKDAVRAYQDILLDDTLSGASHVEGRYSRRAEFAATQAIASVVRDHPSAYEAFDEASQNRLRDLTSSEEPASPEALEQLAEKYPLARSAPRALLSASDRYEAEGQTDRALAALESAMQTMRLLEGRRAPRNDVAGEIAGRYIMRLAESGRVYAASRALDQITSERPRLGLTAFGEPIEAGALARELSLSLAGLSRRPRIGERVTGLAQLLTGWMLVEPISTSRAAAHDHVLLYSKQQEKLALFGIASEGAPASVPSPASLGIGPEAPLKPIWTRNAPAEGDAHLIRHEPSHSLVLWGADDLARIEAIDAVTGETMWQTPAFGTLFEVEPQRRRTGMTETPLDGPARLSDLMVAVSQEHVALIERTGRAAIFSRETGEIVWAELFDVPVVYEAAMNAGVLALVGERPGNPRLGEAMGVAPVLLACDIAQKRTLMVDHALGSLPRWVRVDGAGHALVGLDGGLIYLDTRRATQLWAIDDPAVRMSGDAWLVSERAIVMGPDRQLWQIETGTGELRDAPLEDLSRIGSASRIELSERASGEIVFTTDRGMMVFGRFGSLIGGDATGGVTRVLPPAAGESVYAMLAEDGAIHAETGSVYLLSMLDAESGMLLSRANLRLLADPDAIALIDGHIIVSAKNATLVYEAPAQ